MKPKWLYALSCIAILSTYFPAAVVWAKNTHVVVSSDEDIFGNYGLSSGDGPVELTEMLVRSVVSMRYAHTSVVMRMANPARYAQDTDFHVLLPETAFISGFYMHVGRERYKAFVQNREEAEKTYQNAVAKGITAAQISARIRDSNHFKVSVNLEPRSKVVFNLTYEELLIRRNGVYNHVINLFPGNVVPKMEVTVQITESQKITVLRIPELRTGNEVDATKNDKQYSKSHLLKIQRSSDQKNALITFTPDSNEQRRLMQVYVRKATTSPKDRQYDNFLGQFVVQYDLEHPTDGEILVNDGYFVHFFVPPVIKPLDKHVVFVLDTSGSMRRRKLDQLKGAMKAILDDLKPNDYFNIVEFNTKVKVHQIESARRTRSRRPTKPTTVIASHDNIAKAKTIVSRFSARGGTNIYAALIAAINIIDEKIPGVNKDNLQSIIIFLTDGHSNYPGTNNDKIINDFTNKNNRGQKSALYSLAFGKSADRNLLRTLALRNGGFMRQIYEASDAELQLKNFYSVISIPLLADARFIYPSGQVMEGSLTQHEFHTVFKGSEVIVAGRVETGASELTPHVNAFCASQSKNRMKNYKVNNEVPVTDNSEYGSLERLWAYLTIKQLLDERDANPKDNGPGQRALDIALQYEFVTPLTSLVVVKSLTTGTEEPGSVGGRNEDDGDPTAFIPRTATMEQTDDAGLGSRFGSGPETTTVDDAVDAEITMKDVKELQEIEGLTGSDDSNSEDGSEERVIFGAAFNSATSSTTSSSGLKKTHQVEGYNWVLRLLNNDTNTLEFLSNGNNVALELSELSDPPKDNVDIECTVSTDESSATGKRVCVYLTRCVAAKYISPDHYRDTYCRVQNKYAGICCQQDKVKS